MDFLRSSFYWLFSMARGLLYDDWDYMDKAASLATLFGIIIGCFWNYSVRDSMEAFALCSRRDSQSHL